MERSQISKKAREIGLGGYIPSNMTPNHTAALVCCLSLMGGGASGFHHQHQLLSGKPPVEVPRYFFMSLVSISKYEMEVPDWQNLGHMPAARLQRWLKMQISSTSHFHRRQSGMCRVRKGRFRAGRPKTTVSAHKNQTFPQ